MEFNEKNTDYDTVLTGCGKTKYDFLQSIENLEKVEVVIMGELNNPYTKHEYTLIKEVNLNSTSDFIDDFNQVECYKRLGDPKELYTGDKAFKIIYSNGQYEIITDDAQGWHRNSKKLSTGGFYRFDEEQFNNLLERYSN